LLRFGTGDLSAYTEAACACGRTAYRLTGIVGRASDAVKVRGMFVIARQAAALFDSFAELAGYQLVVGRQQHRDQVTLKLELKDSSADRDTLAKAISERFQDDCRVKIDRFEFLDKGSIPEDAECIVDERCWE
jgi:phenylacetate-CoA ligase